MYSLYFNSADQVRLLLPSCSSHSAIVHQLRTLMIAAHARARTLPRTDDASMRDPNHCARRRDRQPAPEKSRSGRHVTRRGLLHHTISNCSDMDESVAGPSRTRSQASRNFVSILCSPAPLLVTSCASPTHVFSTLLPNRAYRAHPSHSHLCLPRMCTSVPRESPCSTKLSDGPRAAAHWIHHPVTDRPHHARTMQSKHFSAQQQTTHVCIKLH